MQRMYTFLIILSTHRNLNINLFTGPQQMEIIEDTIIEVISKSEIRYKGSFKTFNSHTKTIILHSVRSFGTENRKTLHIVEKSPNIYETVSFRLKNLKCFKNADNEWVDIYDICNFINKQPEDPQEELQNNEYLLFDRKREKRASMRFYNAQKTIEQMNVVIPDEEYNYSIGEYEKEKVDEIDLERESKKYYDSKRSFYDNFKN